MPLPDLRRRNNESKKLHLKEAQNNVLIEYTEPHREKSMSTKQNGANRKKKENNNREDRQYPGQDGAEKALRQPRHSQSVKVQHQHHNDKWEERQMRGRHHEGPHHWKERPHSRYEAAGLWTGERELGKAWGGGAKALIGTPSTNGSCYCYDAWNTGGMACLLWASPHGRNGSQEQSNVVDSV